MILARIALWLMLTAACASAQAAVSIGGHYALRTLDGQEVSERTFLGKWQLIYFGFTLCPDACPTTLGQVRSALRELGPLADQLQPIFITVDPERDTPEQLRAYLAHFDSRIIGLRGSPSQTSEASQAFRIYFKARPAPDGGAGYSIDHSSFLFLLKPDGSFAQLLQADQPGHSLAATLRKFLQ